MNITIKVEAAELSDAINNLSVALGGLLAARADAKARAEKTVETAKAAKPAPAPAEPAPKVEEKPAPAADDEDINKLKGLLQTLAQSKSKTAGAQAVKAAISEHGGQNINTTPVEKLKDLKVALEALA